METVREAKAAAKMPRMEEAPLGDLGAFEVLPQELILFVLAAVSSSADKPAELLSAMLTCKKFKKLGMNPQVLKVASAQCVSVRADRWCPAADLFLRGCGNDGNANANYFLGMVWFYCLGERGQGWSRMMMAARSGHAEATFALAVIRLNGTGGTHVDHSDQRAAAHLCALASTRGHIGALRELGNCLIHGLGVSQNIAAGRRLTVWANLQELRAKYPEGPALDAALAHVRRGNSAECLTGEFGCFAAVPPCYRWAHPANKFLTEWFAARPLPPPPAKLLLMCSVPTCGRPETRPLEFRRCTVCSIARYCSRACRALHWRMGHRAECVPVHQWLVGAVANAQAVNVHRPAAAGVSAADNVFAPM